MDTYDPRDSQSPPPGGLDPLTGSRFDAWRYRDDVPVTGADLVGYKVEATDGGIGKVDQASYDVNAACLVVDTGPWIFGKKVLIPAGTVNHIDRDDRKVYVDRTKAQIKDAPEFDPDTMESPEYRDKVGGYYNDTYGYPGAGYPGPINEVPPMSPTPPVPPVPPPGGMRPGI